MGYVIEDLLSEFSSSPFKGPIPYSLQYSHHAKAFHLLTICATHGDEVGSIPSALTHFKAFTAGKTPFKGQWTLIWGNPEASKIRKRFVQKDLNRLYGRLEDTSLEGCRALEISHIIKGANLFVDFHQTIMPTLIPFYSLRFNKNSYHLARALGKVNVLLSHSPLEENHKDVKTQVDFASLYNIPAVTVELGVKGFHKSSQELANHLFYRLLEIASSCCETIRLEDILARYAFENPNISIFECVHREPFLHPDMGLNKGWKNFAPVQKDEVIGYRDASTPLVAPQKGVMIFPKYPQRNEQGQAEGSLPGHLYVLADVQKSH